MIDASTRANATHRTNARGPGRSSVATPPSRPKVLQSAHLVGICGTGMKALAEFLTDRQVEITGSDLQQTGTAVRAMQRRGLRIHAGHHDKFLPRGVDLLVYSPAVGVENPERQLATKLGIPQLSYSQMLGWLAETRTGVAIAGTHGKSTTTAMVAGILGEAGREPSAIIGAELAHLKISGWAGNGPELVLEACEYKRSFLDIRPVHAAILNVEPDHFDYYTTTDDLVTAFTEFAAGVSPQGRLVVRGNCERSRIAATATAAEVCTFGSEPGSDWWIGDPRPAESGTRFRVFHDGAFLGDVLLRVPGRHNALNAIAAIAVCAGLDVPFAAVQASLAEFPGVRRRFEDVGSWRGMALVDDYAHHPTAVTATLRAARERFGKRRIWCAFQPHQVSRLNELMEDFAAAFGDANEILVAPVFTARESVGGEAETASMELSERIVARGGRARYNATLDDLVATIDREAGPGDVLITMGAGDIDRVHLEFTRRLRGHHARR